MADRVMTPWGYQSAVNPGGYNSKDVDYDAFYSGMYPQSKPVAGATPVVVPGTAYGSILANKDQSQFGNDNPLQAGYPALNSPYANPAWGAAQPKPKTPVNLTVTGKGVPYNNPGWGAGTLAQLMASMGQQQGANPGMEGNGAFGNTPMASGIPAQLPPADGSVGLPKWKGAAVAPPTVAPRQSKLPFSGWDGAQHNGASTFEPRYSSGGYLFDAGGVQIGRDPKGVIPQTYQGTPQAAMGAQRREALTAGTQPQQNAIQSMGDIGWLMKQLGNTAPKVGQAYGAGGNDYTYTANGFQPTPKTGK